MVSRTMLCMPQVGTTRNIVPLAGARIVIDGCGDLRLMSAGALEEELSRIEIREGGRIRVVQQEVNLLTTSPIDIERPLDLDDLRVSQWWENTKTTQNDHRNGTFYYVKAGEDVAKRELRDVIITKYSNGELDAGNEDEPQKEKFTIQIITIGEIEVIT